MATTTPRKDEIVGMPRRRMGLEPVSPEEQPLQQRPSQHAAGCARAGYLATDTHWQTLGQAALLEPLLGFLRREGLLD